MKHLLLFTLLLVMYAGSVNAQLEWMPTYGIEHIDTLYGDIVYPGTIIRDYSTGEYWLVTAKYGSSYSLSTSPEKILQFNEGGTSPGTEFNYVDLIPQTTFPSAKEGRLVAMQGNEGVMLYMYQDGVWWRFLPLNKSVNGVQIVIPDSN